MSKAIEAMEAMEQLLRASDIRIVLESCISAEGNEVAIRVVDVGGRNPQDLATGVCDWDADDSLEEILVELLDIASPE